MFEADMSAIIKQPHQLVSIRRYSAMQMNAVENFRPPSGKKMDLKDYDPCWIPEWASAKEAKDGKKAVKNEALDILEKNRQKLANMQELFWASDEYSMLIILQGMDAAGKDGVIRHVMSGVNPQGCQVTGFKTPTEEELNHNFLWRYNKALPERGRIGIFNRSYYEDVLIVKVRPEVLEKQKLPPGPRDNAFWKQRYDDINSFERHLTRNGAIILKFFLNVSKERQRQRLLKRLEEPDKNWKFSLTDLSEREKWKDYMKVYEDALSETSTKWAPWYVIPADKKWVTLASVSEILVSQIEGLNLKYPVLSIEQAAEFEKAKAELNNE
jgi:PPK2 family polyphosphate:nucleotide phosphotransferase